MSIQQQQQDEYVWCRNLRSERERLGWTQDVVADALEVTTKTVSRWEARTPIPADKLAALAARGVDVQYVITGVRSENAGGDPDDSGARLREAKSAAIVLKEQVARLVDLLG